MKKIIFSLALTLAIFCTSCENVTPEGPEVPETPETPAPSYKHGTFVLNEGNMSTGPGTLIYISPEGEVTDSIYWRVNGSHLGNTCQDMFFANDKIYIISQNGGEDGRLVVANAETLKKEAGYQDELASLSRPTNIAVTGNEVYIRDGAGINLFNLETKELKAVEGTERASMNHMVVVDGKVFAAATPFESEGNRVIVIKDGKVVEKIAMDDAVSGIAKTGDGNIYVSCKSTPAKIVKISVSDYSVIQSNEIAESGVDNGWGVTPGISAKGDTVYFDNNSTKIYRHIFSKKETSLMTDVSAHVENAKMMYNNLSVNPETGDVWFTSIKGYGNDYMTNDISVFNFDGGSICPIAVYKDYTRFPAGVFFAE